MLNRNCKVSDDHEKRQYRPKRQYNCERRSFYNDEKEDHVQGHEQESNGWKVTGRHNNRLRNGYQKQQR